MFLRQVTVTGQSNPCQGQSLKHFSSQDSLLKLLLNIEDFQPPLIKLLLEKLGEISCVTEGQEEEQETNVPRLILTALRWLDKMVDSAGLVEKMQEILEVSSDYHRLEVIMALPEILPPGQHNTIATYLHSLLRENKSLTSCIVDCLGNLSLSPAMVNTTQKRLLKNLPLFEFSSLPSVVDFLLSQCTPETVNDVVPELRSDLSLTPRTSLLSQRPSGPSQSKAGRREKEKEQRKVEKSILEKINISITCDSTMADAWVKAIESLTEAGEMKPLDLLVVFHMYAINTRRKALENLLKSKIRSGVLTSALMVTMFERHSAVLSNTQILSDFLQIAASIISLEPGQQIYISGFTELKYCRVEIVTELAAEVDRSPSALKVLTYLSLHHTEDLSALRWCLTPLLENLSDQMTLGQVRPLLALMARLVWRPSATNLDDQLVIFVKKQLNTSITFYRRVGVVGVVVCAKAMVSAYRKHSDSIGEPMAESSRSESRLEMSGLFLEAQDLLQFAEVRTESDPDLAGLFLDEITTSFLVESEDNTSMDFIKQMRQDQLEKIESDYVQEQKSIDCEEFNIPMSCELDVSEEDKHNVVILAKKVMEVTTASNRTKSQAVLSKMIPTLRLTLRSTELVSKLEEDPLDDLLSLLGCSVLIFSNEIINRMNSLSQQEKNAVCSTHFYAINWLTELINFFSKEEDTEVRKLVLLRLKQIISLRETLQRLLQSNPTFKPPAALFCEDTSKWSPPTFSSPKEGKVVGKGGKGKGKGRKTKTVVSATMVSQASALGTQSGAGGTQVARILSQTGREVRSRPVDLRLYRPFFRELDLAGCLATIRGEPLTTDIAPDFEEEAEDPKLRPPELLFLLKDLHLKLETVVRSKVFPGNNKSFAKMGFTNLLLIPEGQIITAVMSHLKYILSHLDQLKDFFQRLHDMSESREEQAKLITPHSIIIMDCVKVGLKILDSFFSWTGFSAAENVDLLRRSLMEVVERVMVLGEELQLSFLVSESIKYFSSFSVCSITADQAAVHLSLMATLAQFKEEEGVLREVAAEYLEEDWRDVTGEKDKGAEFNVSVGKLLKIYLENRSNIYEDLSCLCVNGTSKVIQTDQPSEKYPLINKGTLNIVYKTILPSLVSEVKKLTSGPSSESKVQYTAWSQALETYVTLITDLQRFEKTKPLVLWAAALRYSKPFIEHFVKQGSPWCSVNRVMITDHSFPLQECR